MGRDGPASGAAARGRNLALLVILARGGSAGVAREKLSYLLWPESDGERARHSLDQAMYTLRRGLGADAFLAGATTIALNPEVVDSDVARFTAAFEAGDMERAVELWAGEFLDGFHLSGSAEFERWVERERALLRGQLMVALESLADRAAVAGDTAALVRYRTRLASADPLSSRLALALMEALEAAGDRPGALRVADLHAAAVRDELDAPPDPGLLAFADTLRRTSVQAPTGDAMRSDRPPDGSALHEPARIDVPADEAQAAGGAAVAVDRASDPTHPAIDRSRRSVALSLPWLALVGVIAIAAVVASRAANGAASEADVRAKVEIAGFENQTGNPEFDAVGLMAADWITDGLVRTGLVQVTENAIGGLADAVVTGSVFRIGDSIRIRARITRADGQILQALDPLSAPASEPLRVIEPLRQRVLGALGTLYDDRLSPLAPAVMRPPSVTAYRGFAVGIEAFADQDYDAAATSFRLAARLDEGFVQPRLWLAWSLVWDNRPAAADSVIRSLTDVRDEMSPLERAWHDRLAAGVAGDHEASFRAARRMVEIAPRSGWVVALADAALDTNRPGVAIATLLHAGMDHLGPERRYAWDLLTLAYHLSGDYERELEASEQATRALGAGWSRYGDGVPALAALGRIDALDERLAELQHAPSALHGIAPLEVAIIELRSHGFESAAGTLLQRAFKGISDPMPQPSSTEPSWAFVLYEMGRWQDAKRAFELEPKPHHEFRERAVEGLLAARLNNATAARQVADDLASIDEPFLLGDPTFQRARIEAALGNTDVAIRLLRQSFAEGQTQHAWHAIRHLIDFDPLRSHPSFIRLIEPRS